VQFDARYRWALALGLGTLAAIGAGGIAGRQVAAEVNPFYANLATPEPEIVDASFTTPEDPPASTTDLSYGRGDARVGSDEVGGMR